MYDCNTRAHVRTFKIDICSRTCFASVAYCARTAEVKHEFQRPSGTQPPICVVMQCRTRSPLLFLLDRARSNDGMRLRARWWRALMGWPAPLTETYEIIIAPSPH